MALTNVFGFDPFVEFMAPFTSGMGLSNMPLSSTRRTAQEYPMDIEETDTAYEIIADAPGLHPDNISVDVSDDRVLTIKGEAPEKMRPSREGEQRRFGRTERGRRSFVRQFTLPDGVDIHNINAHLENGILKVIINKVQATPRPQPRKIPVKGGMRGAMGGERGEDIPVSERTEGATTAAGGAGGVNIGQQA